MNSPRIRPDAGADRGEAAPVPSAKLGRSENAGLSAFSGRPASPWLFGRWFDLLFLANIAWPIVLLVQFSNGFVGRTGVQFWQVYFITTPHRWITLAIVFLDRDRFRAQRGWFLGIAAVVVAICTAVKVTTGTITCLLAIDYVWNAWHFASQHHGVYRIYSRMGGPGSPGMAIAEKVLLRGFLLYVIVRIAGGTLVNESMEGTLMTADWAVLAVPALFLVREAVTFERIRTGRAAYLVSVCTLYTSILWAVHTTRPALVLALTTASALFHAVEYLAIVGWSVQKRYVDRSNLLGLLAWFAPRWGITLTLFVVILGSVGWMMDRQLLEVWLFINVIVAFLHYAYDGLIWRRGRTRSPSAPTATAPDRAALPAGAGAA
ncbi:MAG TPA: hypothetical protein VM452_06030 [Caulifigura sp.]|nr:hypothetical protein [Caulifigura sp.]